MEPMMRNDRLMRRVAAAFPSEGAFTPDAAEDLFASIVAGPGDPDFRVGSGPRWTMPVGGRRMLGATAVLGVGAAAAVVAIAGTGSRGAVSPHGLRIEGAHAQETAFVVHRLRVQLAAGNWVTHYSSAGIAAGDTTTGWTWTDPSTGIEYARSTETNASGQTVSVDWTATRRTQTLADGRVADTGQSVWLDYGNQTYTQGPLKITYTPGRPVTGLSSSPAQIAAALQSGTVSQTGTSTINGTPVIALRISGEQDMTLYVDAATDRPVRTVVGSGTPITTDLLPATAANRANTRAPAVPAGFTAARPGQLRQ
jgi:hypothetical protein